MTEHKFKEGDLVQVHEHPARGTLAITEPFPFWATVTEQGDIREDGDRRYVVEAGGTKWTVLESMLSPGQDSRFAEMEAELATARLRLAAHQEWRETLVKNAHEMADAENMCPTFDDFMEKHGLPRRSKTWTVQTTLTVTASIDVEAPSEADARRQVRAELDTATLCDVDSAIEGAAPLYGVDATLDQVHKAEEN